MQHTSPGGFQVRKLYAVQTPLCSFNKKKYHISRQCLFQIFNSGWILINDNHTLAPVKKTHLLPLALIILMILLMTSLECSISMK